MYQVKHQIEQLGWQASNLKFSQELSAWNMLTTASYTGMTGEWKGNLNIKSKKKKNKKTPNI